MKKILLACGSGICTSTAVHKKVEEMLISKGYAGQFEITQCKVSEAPSKSPNFDRHDHGPCWSSVPLRQRHSLSYRCWHCRC